MRIDKLLSNYGIGSRSEVKQLLKKGIVKVNNRIIKNPSFKIDLYKDIVYLNDQPLKLKEHYYYMLNKPAGYITAKSDKIYPVVMEFFKKQPYFNNLFPVGRLDIDTEGLIIITTDGTFAHRISHPKWNVEKEYYAIVKGNILDKNLDIFENKGIFLKKDRYQTKPFKIKVLSTDKNTSKILITVKEGKYHIVKKIMAEIGNFVIYLKRIRIGTLKLDDKLKQGEFRELTEDEIRSLKSLVDFN